MGVVGLSIVYNYYRTYDPATGRYLESDPIGLAAGLNTYAYVGNMPTMYFDPFGLEPYAQDFWDNYLDYDNYGATDAWNKIGGNLNKTYGPYSNSCAARVSYGLNYGGEPIPANVPGGNRNYGGDNKRYIVSARQLRSYLKNRWGDPDKALSTRADLRALIDSLSPDQVAVVVSQGHAAVVSKSYKDGYVDGYLGDAWILPLKPEPSECGACDE